MRERLAPWIGRDIHEAISAYGPPSSIYPNGATTIYTWASTGSTYATTDVIGSTMISRAGVMSCRIWFDVDGHDRIAAWHWEGHC